MFRALIAVSSAVALELAALGAPLVHVHLDDDDHEGHHAGARVHAHLGGHPGAHRHAVGHDHDGAVVLEGADSEGATGLQLFVAVEPAPLTVPSLPEVRFVLAVPLESILGTPPLVVHSHGPPALVNTGPRAPPLFLS